jgi:hypothetical protein
MDTHLPPLLTQSSVRQPPLMPAALATILPAQPIPHMPTPASGMHPSLYYSQYASQVAAPAAVATPWWVWSGGGAVAVGIGVAAAVWYAGGGDTKKPPIAVVEPQVVTQPPQPVVTQAEPTLVKPTSFEVKFDSLPSGGVYADGQSAELCRTPCAFSIMLDDGGPTDKRTYVVRSDGYKDMQVVVDLAASKRAFKLTLERIDAVADKPTEKKPPSGKGGKRPKKPADKVTKPESIDKPVDKQPTDTANLEDPTNGKPIKRVPPKPDKPESIDKTELNDPFKRKR